MCRKSFVFTFSALVIICGMGLPSNAAQSLGNQLYPNCIVKLKGQNYFQGNVRCLRLLPVVNLTGVYVVGFETSLFVPGIARKPTAKELQTEGVWVDFIRNPAGDIGRAVNNSGELRAFVVKFRAHYKPMKGFYGNRGGNEKGMLVIKVLGSKPV